LSFTLPPRRPLLLFLLLLLAVVPVLPANGQQPNSLSPEAAPVPSALIYKWELKEVRYTDGQPPFVPHSYSGVTLSPSGGIGWSDGCNYLSSQYRIEGQTFIIGPDLRSTLMACPSVEEEDVNYAQVTHYELDGHTLYLHTPSQVYILERFPYSPLSLHPWSLYSIVDQQTRAECNVERFRTEYHHLFFRVEEDRRFHFTDLDREEFSGTLQLAGEAIHDMEYDHDSEERVRGKPEQQDYLVDNTQDYQKTADRYPTTYAQRLHWEAVKSFKVGEGTLPIEEGVRTTSMLDLYTDTQIYRFLPR
jgi:heat shock protein HslJ